MGVSFGPAAQTLDVRAEHQPVEQRWGEVERRADRQGVTALEYPAVTLADGNPAMPAGVTEQRNHAGIPRLPLFLSHSDSHPICLTPAAENRTIYLQLNECLRGAQFPGWKG